MIELGLMIMWKL